MSEGGPEKFNDYILPDGRCVSLEDVEMLFEFISCYVEEREKVRGILRSLIDKCLDGGLLEAALSYLEKEYSITDDPQGIARIHLATGIVFERMRDYKSAADCYKAALDLPRGNDETWYFLHNNLGYCLNRLEKHDEAETLCGIAIEIDPRRHNAYKNLGLAYQGQGLYPEAAVLFLKAAFIFPPDPRSLGHLGEILANHREEVERVIPDIAVHLSSAIEARQNLMQ